ncbi:hypothetical protein Pmani_028230 [Petrolisthes manimaculis]|uniref:Uncharacterized protein n=1 Tax=Petrolisthes manimaculis TaxID=1843537 RepID=A0AAE1P2H9_9EUCA|nr:hypothetical protein Pmani_028230 [Petrolisthes manimaculis]
MSPSFSPVTIILPCHHHPPLSPSFSPVTIILPCHPRYSLYPVTTTLLLLVKPSSQSVSTPLAILDTNPWETQISDSLSFFP